MDTYGFEVAHGYEVRKGFVEAESESQARDKILNEDWDDIIDTYDCNEFTKGYEILEIWLA